MRDDSKRQKKATAQAKTTSVCWHQRNAVRDIDAQLSAMKRARPTPPSRRDRIADVEGSSTSSSGWWLHGCSGLLLPGEAHRLQASTAAARSNVIEAELSSKDGTGLACVWPAAEALCDFLRHANQGAWALPSPVIEIGAGVGLPGLLAAKLGAPSVTLTDYHPVVLSLLRESIVRNGFTHRCRADVVDWDANDDAEPNRSRRSPTWPLAIGADLAVSSRGAAGLARAVRRTCLRASRRPGIFIYAHTERRAIFRAADGSVQREASDSALDALLLALSDFECVPLEAPSGDGGAEPDDEPVRLFAFGAPGCVRSALPAHVGAVGRWRARPRLEPRPGKAQRTR